MIIKGKGLPLTRHENAKGDCKHRFVNVVGWRFQSGCGRVWRRESILVPPAFALRTVHAATSRYTDWTIPAHITTVSNNESDEARILKTLIILRLLENVLAFYETSFTKSRHWPCNEPDESTLCHDRPFNIHFNNILSNAPSCPKWPFPFRFPIYNSVCIFTFPVRATRPAYLIRLKLLLLLIC